MKTEQFAKAFQSTHPCGVRLSTVRRMTTSITYFNQRTPVECDYRTDSASPNLLDFNQRTPVECDGLHSYCITFNLHFNQRTPVECDANNNTTPSVLVFQSTHPCGVRRKQQQHHTERFSISINAPLWSATDAHLYYQSLHHDFNQRIPVECDFSKVVHCFVCFQFQSTHPCGVRHSLSAMISAKGTISINAPLWSATRSLFTMFSKRSYFNQRTPVECDSIFCQRVFLTVNFNQRTPVECDSS